MINVVNLIQLKAFARQDALLLALLWAASFACIMLLQAGLVGNLLALATPFLLGYRLKAFRNGALGGVISFRRAYAYCAYTFLYASLVFALVQFGYFQFVDKGSFAQLITETMRLVLPIYEQNGMTKAEIQQSIDMITLITPTQWTFMFMMQNLFFGAIVCLPIALIGKRTR